MASKRKHVTLSLTQKLEILEKLKQGCSNKVISAKYNIGRATIYDIKKKENQLLQYTSQMDSEVGKRKVMRKGENDKLDAAVYRWFIQQRSNGLPLSGAIIKEKALVFNKQLGDDEHFVASDGWLSNWKKRHGVRQLVSTGECHFVHENNTEHFKNDFLKMIKEEKLTPAAVYNVDETTLFFKMLPPKTLPREYKQQKERVTLMACCNADGSHKLPLLVVGKPKKPQCFQQNEMCTLPIIYCDQEKARITSELITRWFHDTFVPAVEENLKKKRLPIKSILFIANASVHPFDLSLQSGDIRAIFFPPNVTALIQPMEQGIFESIKRHYRHAILKTILDECENDSMEAMAKAWNTIDMRDVIFETAEAWNIVEKDTIVKCWKKIWPSIENELEHRASSSSASDMPSNSDATFIDMFHKLSERNKVDEEDLTKWLNEQNCAVDQILTHEKIVENIKQEEESNDEQDTKEIENMKISHSAGAEAANIFLEYIMQQPETCNSEVMLIKRLRDEAFHREATSLIVRRKSYQYI